MTYTTMTFAAATTTMMKSMLARFVAHKSAAGCCRTSTQRVVGSAAWNQESAIEFLSNDDHFRDDFLYSLSMASSLSRDDTGANKFLNTRQKEQLAISKGQLLQ
uniref:Uncharacterized protein n=1 Tax=Pseudo-nitzschia australis TaxID=44445 RepID=A0A7S4EPI2_9STRA|mmetsp:Transcript_19283/g.41935  ORF Transcript_19283/g.41935 Transcript_19283/m.41935 type:complete len:104 (+) Transcript_19283:102-413(+)